MHDTDGDRMITELEEAPAEDAPDLADAAADRLEAELDPGDPPPDPASAT